MRASAANIPERNSSMGSQEARPVILLTGIAEITTEIYAWEVANYERLTAPQPPPSMKRLKRSLYLMESAPGDYMP